MSFEQARASVYSIDGGACGRAWPCNMPTRFSDTRDALCVRDYGQREQGFGASCLT